MVKWLKSENRRYKQFVANRVAGILDSSEEEQWRWLPGNMNPADDGTRPIAVYDPNNRWKIGLEFLSGPANLWASLDNIPRIDNCDEELRQGKYMLTIYKVNPNLFDRFSNYRVCVKGIYL